MLEKKLLPFSGPTIESAILYQHKNNCESSLVPALQLRQVIDVERYSEAMKLAIDCVVHESNNVSMQKKFFISSKLHLIFE